MHQVCSQTGWMDRPMEVETPARELIGRGGERQKDQKCVFERQGQRGKSSLMMAKSANQRSLRIGRQAGRVIEAVVHCISYFHSVYSSQVYFANSGSKVAKNTAEDIVEIVPGRAVDC